MNNLSEQYLLTTPIAEQLYQETAKDLPIIDYHNHLNVADIVANRQFENITQIWVASDPYKHRAMRILGVPEEKITGDASDFEKFKVWCEAFPKLIGNPLYDWSVLEMNKVFKIDLPINGANAEELWDAANVKLAEPEFTAGGLLKQFNSEYLAPCSSIADDLKPFENNPTLAPSLRGDDMLRPTKDFLKKLATASGMPITDDDSYKAALAKRVREFDMVGCRVADHALDNGFKYYEEAPSKDYIKAVLAGDEVSAEDGEKFFSTTLVFLAGVYTKQGWALQFHIGAQRYTSSKIRAVAGGAGGYACLGNSADIKSLVGLFDHMEQAQGQLPKTILYTLNPIDNAALATLSGSFRGLTQGPAWWYCDHLQGMRDMLETFNTHSVLRTFIGMTTDSRSLLSMLRHDYFRRTLCGWIGEKAEKGEMPDSMADLKPLVYALCYGNARQLITK